MRLGQALLGTTLAAAVLAGGAGAARSPAALAAALVHAKAGKLPHGYSSPVVAVYKQTASAKSHGAVGGASITADNGGEVVIYIVFKNPADALADFEHANFGTTSHKAGPSSLPKPNVEVDTSTSGKSGLNTITVGITDLAFVYKNVLVQAGTSSEQSTKHGDIPGAVALAQYALRHLQSVS
jgi:hypothetical protein